MFLFMASCANRKRRLKGESIWGRYLVPYDIFVFGVTVGQKYMMENTTLATPAFQSSNPYNVPRNLPPLLQVTKESIGPHGLNMDTHLPSFPSPIGMLSSILRHQHAEISFRHYRIWSWKSRNQPYLFTRAPYWTFLVRELSRREDSF